MIDHALSQTAWSRVGPGWGWLIQRRSAVGLKRPAAESVTLVCILIRFQRTELVDAPAERMFAVFTDYAAYLRINPFVKTVRVLRRDGQRPTLWRIDGRPSSDTSSFWTRAALAAVRASLCP
jgi:hypothetical protein